MTNSDLEGHGSKKRMPVPITFIVVVVAVVLLTVFFGAWAVAADAGAQGRSFTFGVGIVDPVAGATDSQPTAPGAGDQEDLESAGDTWWGKTLLRACPFH